MSFIPDCSVGHLEQVEHGIKPDALTIYRPGMLCPLMELRRRRKR
jgi:hypothetical protein